MTTPYTATMDWLTANTSSLQEITELVAPCRVSISSTWEAGNHAETVYAIHDVTEDNEEALISFRAGDRLCISWHSLVNHQKLHIQVFTGEERERPNHQVERLFWRTATFPKWGKI